jgi:hypothetical protein
MTSAVRRWRRIMDWLNPVEWFAWLYGKFFQHNVVAGGFTVVGVFALIGFFVWVRAVDKYKEDHLDPKAPTVVEKQAPPTTDDSGRNNKSTSQVVTEDQALEIVRKIIDRYKKKNNGKAPTVGWINQRLAEQGQPFTVYSIRPPSPETPPVGIRSTGDNARIVGNTVNAVGVDAISSTGKNALIERNLANSTASKAADQPPK